MPDDAMASPLDLDGDLRRYFALTTATELPRRVRQMSAVTLRARRRSYGPLLGGGGVGLAVAAVAALVVVGLHHGATGGAGSTAASSGAALANPGASIAYPGVDISRLGLAGVVLQPPAGHGIARVTAAEAQSAARAVSPNAGGPGPAVLAWAQLGGSAPASTCLCWVVEVPVLGGAVNGPASPAPTPPIHNVLVLVDATTGRIVDTVAAPGP